jgi:alpha-tubulin suppressor-like RCC1 family protein
MERDEGEENQEKSIKREKDELKDGIGWREGAMGWWKIETWEEEYAKIKVLFITCMNDVYLLLSDTGEVYTFGWNGYGQLGVGHQESQDEPQKVDLKSFQPKTPVRVHCGSWNTVVELAWVHCVLCALCIGHCIYGVYKASYIIMLPRAGDMRSSY